MITKIIHQIHIGDKPLSSQEIEWQKTWKEYNPDYEYIMWDDQQLKELNPLNQQYIDQSTSYSMKSDILRYEILYQYGGVYVDTDFECLKNINPFVKEKDFILCKQIPPKKHGKHVCGAFLAASKNHKLVKIMIDGIPHRAVTHKNQCCTDKYGPRYLQDNVPEEMWLDGKYVYPFMWYDKKDQPAEHDALNKKYPEAYAVHWWSGSWNNSK